MQTQLTQSFQQLTMYSKIGKYISNKILKFNRSSKSRRMISRSLPQVEDYLKHCGQKSKQKCETIKPKTSIKRHRQQLSMTQPPVGFYKVNYSQIQKNPKIYNFNRSVPHFNGQKFHCNETNHVVHEYPDSPLCESRLKGAVQLDRMAGRPDMKGSERKPILGCHENRFNTSKDYKSIEFGHTRVQMSKDMPRAKFFGKNSELTPEYDYSIDNLYQRMDTHLVPFERVIARGDKSMVCPSGISQHFNQAQIKQQNKYQQHNLEQRTGRK